MVLSSQDFQDLYGVTEERVLNFWASHLQDVMGPQLWSQIAGSTGVYLASILGHFCLEPVNPAQALSPTYTPAESEFCRFADLTQVAELLMRQLTGPSNPLWMESAGAHILLYAGFFQDQHKDRHNINFFSSMGTECYHMAAVGKRAAIMKLMAQGFHQYLNHLADLNRHLRESRYLIRPQN